jgi:type II restriction/modification system DNA methylase subunit YeeA
MTVAEFIGKWRGHTLTERAAAQTHFNDLCRLVGHPDPVSADPAGAWFTFERGAAKAGGGDGWADVWKKGAFGWEYKGLHKDLDAAYLQLLRYQGALDNPPLLVTCDTDRIVVHTHFRDTPTVVRELTLEGLADPEQLSVLRSVFHEPERLRPGKTIQAITEEASRQITDIAQALRARGVEPHVVARFLDRVVFCLFAEDVDLLPTGLFTRIVQNCQNEPERFSTMLTDLFGAMAVGGHFGADRIAHFNGNLFADAEVLTLTSDELRSLLEVSSMDWSNIDASIFGTLFERALDPDKRSQLGAHYTSRADIETLIEPVVMKPLRQEWAAVRDGFDTLMAGPPTPARRRQAAALIREFLHRLGSITVLDPACGSGNFLFVTLQKLKDLEKEVIIHAASLTGFFPSVGPWQLHGIESSAYAHELAQMTVWIGYLQWVSKNGFPLLDEPILKPMSSIQQGDAIMTDGTPPTEPEWPPVEFIVSNPPFLGTKKLRRALGDDYVDKLFELYGNRIPNFSDLCCYWFEKARAQVQTGRARRVGLLATQGIRGGLNREVLKRIEATGRIFFAVSDREWPLDGAMVHVSMVGFDDGSEPKLELDGNTVSAINADLTSSVDVTTARRLAENAGIGYYADVKAGSFDISFGAATVMLASSNPHGRPNSDVLVPWVNGLDVLRRPRDRWIIDFPSHMAVEEAAKYEAPFEFVSAVVKPERSAVKRARYRDLWWIHAEPCDAMRDAIQPLSRFLVTPNTSKHRVFAWLHHPTLPDHAVIVFAREDDYFFGLMHSRVHEVWARATGTQVREEESGFRYTPTTCFETFPMPTPSRDSHDAIASAARDLDALRVRWLHPPEFERSETHRFLASTPGRWPRLTGGEAEYLRLLPREDDAAMAALKKRTLTALYNDPPTWLRDAHARLDAAVCLAYGLPVDVQEREVLALLLELNLARAACQRSSA